MDEPWTLMRPSYKREEENAHRHDRLGGPSVQGLGSPQRWQGGGKIQTLVHVMSLLLINTLTHNLPGKLTLRVKNVQKNLENVKVNI